MTISHLSLATHRGASANYMTVDDANSVEDARSSEFKPLTFPVLYAQLWQILAQQNSSLDFFSIDDLVLLQGLDGASSCGWAMPLRIRPLFGLETSTNPNQVQVKTLRRISLAEARKQALKTLHQAEERRQQEREREAQFWAALDDEA